MKYSIKTLGVLMVVLTLALTTSVAKAEDNSPSPSTRPPLMRASLNTKGPEAHPLQKISEERKEMQSEMKDMRKDFQNDIKDIRKDTRADIASTSAMFKRDMKDMKAQMKAKMETAQFNIRKAALVKVLNNALENLDSIVTRIQSRISKAETSGRDMTEPKALLVTAQQKIAQARVDVTAFSSLTATSTTTTGTTTTQVDLTKPRKLGDAAIKSVKDARDALQKVVVSIAHHMGLGDDNASSTEKRHGDDDDNATSSQNH